MKKDAAAPAVTDTMTQCKAMSALIRIVTTVRILWIMRAIVRNGRKRRD